MAEKRFIVFAMDEERYSIDLDFVKEIEENYSIIPIPNGPANVEGIINLRGEVVPVYSLRSRFGKAKSNQIGKIILTYVHGSVIGFEVDEICGIEPVDIENILKAPPLIQSDETTYIDCILRTDSGIVVNISVENILSENEVSAINSRISENE